MRRMYVILFWVDSCVVIYEDHLIQSQVQVLNIFNFLSQLSVQYCQWGIKDSHYYYVGVYVSLKISKNLLYEFGCSFIGYMYI